MHEQCRSRMMSVHIHAGGVTTTMGMEELTWPVHAEIGKTDLLELRQHVDSDVYYRDQVVSGL